MAGVAGRAQDVHLGGQPVTGGLYVGDIPPANGRVRGVADDGPEVAQPRLIGAMQHAGLSQQQGGEEAVADRVPRDEVGRLPGRQPLHRP
ncbi:hypothetical protein [Micromonospora sp. NPDC005324]|uniref:hypothetical protein n=1 Tax=Micromonospora sp. NPDC005324 TaxID=3157033 RepID=UPI0033BC0D88